MIFRVNKTENYVVLHKGFLNDSNLSWQAKGMLAYMLSLPNDWEFNVKFLVKQSKNGRDATYAIVRELEQAGYVVRNPRDRDGGKFAGVEYDVFETPQTAGPSSPGNHSTEPPLPEKPDPEKPYTGKPDPENPDLLNNDPSLSNKKTNYNNIEHDETNECTNQRSWADAYYQAFGTFPTPFMIDKINSYIEDGIEEEAVCLIIEKAGSIGAKPSYVTKVLNDWYKAGIRTKEQALEDMQRHEDRIKARLQNGRRNPDRSKEVLYSSEELGW